VFYGWVCDWKVLVSVHKRTSLLVMARNLRAYAAGEKVKILRGKLAGQTMTVNQSANDWVLLDEMGSREVMSKGNVEPAAGFTEEELSQAKRAADKMQGLGSLM
jgi:hypothetical protein